MKITFIFHGGDMFQFGTFANENTHVINIPLFNNNVQSP